MFLLNVLRTLYKALVAPNNDADEIVSLTEQIVKIYDRLPTKLKFNLSLVKDDESVS